MSIINSNPKKYPLSSVQETEAVDTFRFIIDNRYIKPSISTMDKIPNYDGYIELTREDQTPIGKIDVQLKKLADDELDEPKYQCALPFLAYCENSLTPVFLIGIDTENSFVYWLHVSKSFLTNLKIKKKSNSVSIVFPKGNIIKKGADTSYVQLWIQILNEYKSRFQDAERTERALVDLREQYKLLLKSSEQSLGTEKQEYQEIHVFLDHINSYCENEFLCIKKIYFESCWKVGLAYDSYQRDSISYVLYPIPYKKNDLQIRLITQEFRVKLQRQGLAFTRSWPNIIHQDPKRGALQIVSQYIKAIFTQRALPLFHSTLVVEAIFAILNKKKMEVEFENRTTYLIDEIKTLVSSGKLSECLNPLVKVLDDCDIKKIRRIYVKQDRSNHIERPVFIWSYWTPQEIKKNVEIAYKHFPSIYDEIIKAYFPALIHDFRYFGKFNYLIIVVSFKPQEITQLIDYYYLKSVKNSDPKISVYLDSDVDMPVPPNGFKFNQDIMISGSSFQLVSWSKNILSFIFSDVPLQELVYQKLENDINAYIEKIFDKL